MPRYSRSKFVTANRFIVFLSTLKAISFSYILIYSFLTSIRFPDGKLSVLHHYFSDSSFCFGSGIHTCLIYFCDELQNNCFRLFSNISGSCDWIGMVLVFFERAEPTESAYQV